METWEWMIIANKERTSKNIQHQVNEEPNWKRTGVSTIIKKTKVKLCVLSLINRNINYRYFSISCNKVIRESHSNSLESYLLYFSFMHHLWPFFLASEKSDKISGILIRNALTFTVPLACICWVLWFQWTEFINNYRAPVHSLTGYLSAFIFVSGVIPGAVNILTNIHVLSY